MLSAVTNTLLCSAAYWIDRVVWGMSMHLHQIKSRLTNPLGLVNGRKQMQRTAAAQQDISQAKVGQRMIKVDLALTLDKFEVITGLNCYSLASLLCRIRIK